MRVIAIPRAIMKQRKAIQSPWFSNLGTRKNHAGRNMNIEDIIMVFLIALEAVAPIYIPSHMKAANVIKGMIIM